MGCILSPVELVIPSEKLEVSEKIEPRGSICWGRFKFRTQYKRGQIVRRDDPKLLINLFNLIKI